VWEQSGHVQLHVALTRALALALPRDNEGAADRTNIAEEFLEILPSAKPSQEEEEKSNQSF
jgi:hypothetical protein